MALTLHSNTRSFRACRVWVSADQPVTPALGSCPVHGSTECMETFIAASHVASFSLFRFLRWRRFERRFPS